MVRDNTFVNHLATGGVFVRVWADRLPADTAVSSSVNRLLGTGTLSGPGPGQGGSLLELSAAGKHPITLKGDEQRSFLEDGDTVILRGACIAEGARRIGFGDCRGTVLPAQWAQQGQ